MRHRKAWWTGAQEVYRKSELRRRTIASSTGPRPIHTACGTFIVSVAHLSIKEYDDDDDDERRDVCVLHLVLPTDLGYYGVGIS